MSAPLPRRARRNARLLPQLTPPPPFRASRSTFKKRAARAVSEIKKFAEGIMHTKIVRIDSGLNQYVWHKGIRNVPFRVRVKMTRERSEEEDAKEKMITKVTLSNPEANNGRRSFKTLLTESAPLE